MRLILLFLITLSSSIVFFPAAGKQGAIRIVDEVDHDNYCNELASSEILIISDSNVWEAIEARALWFKGDGHACQDLNLLKGDFLLFYDKFISDSLFQHERIRFQYQHGVISECDSTIILNQTNWNFRSWNFIDYFNKPEDENEPSQDVFYASDSTFYYEFYRNEVGVIYQAGFEKMEDEWYLTFYFEFNC